MPSIDVKIELYKTDWCPHCKTAARILSKLNASNIHVYDIERDKRRGQEMVKRTGRTSIPQVFIGDVHVGGASELMQAAQTGYLRELLGVDVLDNG